MFLDVVNTFADSTETWLDLISRCYIQAYRPALKFSEKYEKYIALLRAMPLTDLKGWLQIATEKIQFPYNFTIGIFK